MTLQIHSIKLDSDGLTNIVSTTSLTITVNVFASGQPVDIAYSNDGATFSTYEPFRISKYGFDITTLGGNSDLGRHTVYVRIRDASLNEVTESVSFIYGNVPIAEVKSITTTVNGAEIDYEMIDCGPDKNDLCLVEYSDTGTFTGEEGNATPISSATAHSGTVALLGDKNGRDHTFVWDYKYNLSEGLFSIYIRTQAKNGARTGDVFTFGPFTVNNLNVPAPTFKLDAGDSKFLKIHYVGKDSDGFNPDTVQLTEILDPSGTDILGTPQTLLPVTAGNYQYSYVSSTGDTLGVYTYTFVATVGTIQKAQSFSFELKERISRDPVCPSTPSGVVISGQLIDVGGSPLVDTELLFYPSDIDDPLNGDAVSNKPLSVKTDDCGSWVIELIKNEPYVVVIADLQYRKVIQAPDADAAEFASIPAIQLPVGPRDPYGNPEAPIYDDIDVIPDDQC